MSSHYPQAVFLRALADHIDAHPGLELVNVSTDFGGGVSLQIVRADASGGLIGWARSLGVNQLQVRPLKEHPQVSVLFAVADVFGARSIEVWGCVNALRDALDLTDRSTVISVDDLGRFGGAE